MLYWHCFVENIIQTFQLFFSKIILILAKHCNFIWIVILLAWTSAEEWHYYGLASASTCLVSKLIELRTNWTKLTLMNPPWPPNQGDLQSLLDTVLSKTGCKNLLGCWCCCCSWFCWCPCKWEELPWSEDNIIFFVKWQWANKNAFYDSDSVRVVATAALPGWQVPFDWQFGDPSRCENCGTDGKLFFAASRGNVLVTGSCAAKCR